MTEKCLFFSPTAYYRNAWFLKTDPQKKKEKKKEIFYDNENFLF